MREEPFSPLCPPRSSSLLTSDKRHYLCFASFQNIWKGISFQSLAVRRQEAQGKSHAGQTAAVGEEGLDEGQSDRQRTRSSDTQRQRKHCFQEPASSVSRSQLVTLLHRPGSVGAEAPTLPWCFSPSGSRPNFPPTTHPTPTDFWVFLVSSSAQPALSLSP